MWLKGQFDLFWFWGQSTFATWNRQKSGIFQVSMSYIYVTKPWPAGCELAIGSVPGRTNTQGLEETEEKVLPL